MTIKDYLDQSGKSLQEVVDELKPIAPYITKSLVSYFSNGKAEPPQSIKEWLAGKTIALASEPVSQAAEIVLSVLGKSTREAPLSRRDLCYSTGFTDRQVRRAIEELRKRGEWIVNGQYGDGYYITDNREELNEWLSRYVARAVQINKTASAMRSREPKQVGWNE